MKHWKIILSLIALVAVSAVAGAKIGAGIAWKHARASERVPPHDWPEVAMRKLDDRLHFTAEQREKVRAAMTRSLWKFKGVRQQALAEAAEVMKELVSEVEAVLTPEQKAQFEEIKPKANAITLDLLRAEPPNQ